MAVKSNPGLGEGWESQAWIHLRRVDSGLSALDAKTVEALDENLRASARRPPLVQCGLWQGSAAAALVGLQAARLERRLRPAARQAAAAWEASCRLSPHFDLMSGRAGALLACAELEAAGSGSAPRGLARRLHEACQDRLELLLGLTHDAPVYLGLSHGAAGFLLALENGRAAFGFPVRRGLADRTLSLLAAQRLAATAGRSFWKAFSQDQGDIHHSWCHGAPGIGLALLICGRLTGRKDYRDLAEQALRATWSFQNDAADFCCGTTGRAHILLEAHRLTGRAGFLRQAREVRAGLSKARAGGLKPAAFLKGRLALDYLDLRLLHPQTLPLPGAGMTCA